MSTASASLGTSIEERATDAIRRRARELADQAPALTAKQMTLLRAVFSHGSGGGG
jgi:hypothetical protein